MNSPLIVSLIAAKDSYEPTTKEGKIVDGARAVYEVLPMIVHRAAIAALVESGLVGFEQIPETELQDVDAPEIIAPQALFGELKKIIRGVLKVYITNSMR